MSIERSSERDPTPAAVATGRLTGPAGWPVREVDAPEARPVRALAAALEHAPRGHRGPAAVPGAAGPARAVAARWRHDRRRRVPVGRRVPRRHHRRRHPAASGRGSRPEAPAGSPHGRGAGRARPPPEGRGRLRRRALARGRRASQRRPRRRCSGGSIGFTAALDDGTQAIRWQIRRGAAAPGPAARFADWELAQLWSLPDAAFDRAGFARVAPARRRATGHARGRRPRPRAPAAGATSPCPADALARHLAVFGSTGSGKSTLLLNLVGALAASPIGVTVIDPHGDLTGDILARLPGAAATSVHVLRLADRDHPRGFNFLERRTPDEAQLVTSEFVELFEDLWPRFCGPKMQHYLRHALLTLLAAPEPGTIIELTRVLTDDDFREPLVDALTDPLVAAFWRNEWPGPRERERDTSIKAVLNKLGAFVTYASIRSVVGQGASTIRPRALMDRGDILLVDLSGVGGDNANLFGAMLISRYLIDATGRQGTPARPAPPARARGRRGPAVRHAGDGQDRGRGPQVRPRARASPPSRWAVSASACARPSSPTPPASRSCRPGRTTPAVSRAWWRRSRSRSSRRCAGSRCCSGCRVPTAAPASTAAP